ncbi:MAG: hypothetical protein ABSF21_04805 [Dehalococcoidia bacterium]
MREKLFAICAGVAVLIVLLAVFIPSCDGLAIGTIEVKATLCGIPLEDVSVTYTLIQVSSGVSGSDITGTAAPYSFSVGVGNWTCVYVSGGPAGVGVPCGTYGAYLDDIAPSETQSVAAGGTITFTLNFELKQDAGIGFDNWTHDGIPIVGSEYEAVPCQIIDVHFQQWVNGCEGYNVTVNETSWLKITQVGGPCPVQIFVADDWCAVNKTPEPRQKVSQVSSINNATVQNGASINLSLNMTTLLDVETVWQLVKCPNYTKTINWFGISKAPFVPGVHPCVLFELVLPPGPVQQYTFILQTSAEVALVDDVDVDPANNYTGWSVPPLFLTVTG